MRRVFLFLAAIIFLAAPAIAQRTVVSGTVSDVNGIPYAGGTLQATLSLPVGASGATLNGVQISGATQRVTLDGTGSFLMQLPDNNVVATCTPAGVCTPGGTQWTFAVNISPGIPPPGGTGPQTCNATLTITGVSQTVTASFSGCPALSKVGGGIPSVGINSIGSGTDSGTTNNYIAAANFPAGMGATTSGSLFTMKVNNSNTGASTINVNGSGAFNILSNVGALLIGGEMSAGNAYTFLYLGTNVWVLVGSAGGGVAALTSSQVTGAMTGSLGINGATSYVQAPIEIFTPFFTSNLPLFRQMISLLCLGNGASGCSGGRRFDIGWDADGVAILAAPQIAFVNPVESFSRLDWLGDGTAGGTLVNINDNGHNLHTSGNLFNVIDKNNRTNIAVTATAGGSLMSMDASVAIGTQNVSGCSLTVATGGSWAGKFNSGTTGACTVTITFPYAATTGWTCDAHDTTTVADVINQTGFTTTTATISGTTASGDVITWKCQGF
jgi:hypothetical protein